MSQNEKSRPFLDWRSGVISVQEAIEKKEGPAKIRGWVYRERKSNKRAFIVVRDSTNIIQCLVEREDVPEDVWNAVEKIHIETSLVVEGTLKADERAPTGVELAVKNLEIVGPCDIFPITKDQSPEFLLDNRHLWLRSRRMTSILKIRSTVTGAIHEFFRKRGYHEFTPPIFTPNACEGGATLFEVKYFDDKVYLTQSWQLYAEAAVFALEKIYDVAPTFRAERSKTSRHLAEFWMAEMEAAWMELDEVVQVAKDEVEFIVQEVLRKNRAELELLGRDISKLEKIKQPFPTITYSEALKILKEKEGMEVPWGKDLRTIEEDRLMKHFETPVVVTNYPKETMAFYKPKDPKDPKTALCFDMLAPEGYGEIIGGSQRSTDIEELKEGLEKEGENPEHYEWYLDLRRYGSVPHSGYGLGVERVVAWICGLDNIKDAIPFPRTMLRKSP
ncbi:asparagine--tRNA ligase [Candidatus Woesearchaeota archaeon]|nr:MAG: asparagine--tRNA ligase [Candidatus Woesearchaeota archaeon]